MFLLLDLISESFDLGLMQILEFILVLLVNPEEVVAVVVELGLDEEDLLLLLLLQLLQFVLGIGFLSIDQSTSFLSSSFLRRICRFRFSI
jgi:uncharacterized membrane protein YqaE (UPF0057 family)